MKRRQWLRLAMCKVQMVSAGVLALACAVLSTKLAPKLVALLPVEDVRDEDNTQVDACSPRSCRVTP